MSMQSHQADAGIGIVFRIEEHGIFAVHAAKHDCGNDAAEEQEVDQSIDADVFFLFTAGTICCSCQRGFFAIKIGVDDIINA